MISWTKLGKIFSQNQLPSIFVSHAQAPTSINLGNKIRVYFSSRNNDGKSLPLFVDLDPNNPGNVLYVHQKHVMNFGDPGSFDADGIMPGCILRNSEKLWMYYTGWNQNVSTPYHNSIGLAISKDDGLTFKKAYDGPLLDRTVLEPYIAITPFVIKEDNIWKMWYSSGIKWLKINQKYEPLYVIKYAESNDGINWNRYTETCINQSNEIEAISNPSVIKIDDTYHMWYCYRKIIDFRDGENSYKIGYAISTDGKKWTREDQSSGITTSSNGWDSKMICYPSLFELNNNIYMLYNGNSFGKEGFGYAILEK